MPNSSNPKHFEGVFTALVTPFQKDGSVDFPAFEKLVQKQIAGGVSGLVPCGTTGESPVLSSEEKRTLIEATVRLAKGKALVLAGTGSNDTRKTIEDSKNAEKAGADGLLIVTPYYNKPSQAGLRAHYEAVADVVSVPIILYNVPGRAVISLAASTVAALSKHPRISGIKEASGNLSTLTEIRSAVRHTSPEKSFSFLTGDDPTYWPFMGAGGNGVISVTSNLLPRTFVKMDLKAFEELHSFMNTLFIEANPVPVKTVLSWLGLISEQFRLPLVSLSEENSKKLKEKWSALPSKYREELVGL